MFLQQKFPVSSALAPPVGPVPWGFLHFIGIAKSKPSSSQYDASIAQVPVHAVMPDWKLFDPRKSKKLTTTKMRRSTTAMIIMFSDSSTPFFVCLLIGSAGSRHLQHLHTARLDDLPYNLLYYRRHRRMLVHRLLPAPRMLVSLKKSFRCF